MRAVRKRNQREKVALVYRTTVNSGKKKFGDVIQSIPHTGGPALLKLQKKKKHKDAVWDQPMSTDCMGRLGGDLWITKVQKKEGWLGLGARTRDSPNCVRVGPTGVTANFRVGTEFSCPNWS